MHHFDTTNHASHGRLADAWSTAALLSVLLGGSIPVIVAIVEGYPVLIQGGLLFVFAFTLTTLAVRDRKTFLVLSIVLLLPIHIDLPLGPAPWYTGGARRGPVLWLLDLPIVFLMFFWLADTALGRKFYFPHAARIALAMIGWAGLSLLNATDPLLSFFEIVRMVRGLLLFLLIVNYVRNRRTLYLIIGCLIVGLCCQSVLALAQEVTQTAIVPPSLGGPLEMGTRFTEGTVLKRYIGGTTGAGHALAAYLELLLPLPLVLVLNRSKRYGGWSLALALVWCLGFAVVVLTLVRGAWVAVIFESLLLLVLCRRSLRGLLWSLVVLFVVFTVVFLWSDVILLRLLYSPIVSFESRLDFNLIALRQMLAHPLLGVGVNNFGAVYGESLSYTAKRTTVHNIYLLIGAEMGIVGLVIWVWFLVHIFRLGRRVVLRDDSYLASVALGLLAGIAGMLLHGVVTWLPRYDVIYATFWCMSGLVVAMYRTGLAEGAMPKM